MGKKRPKKSASAVKAKSKSSIASKVVSAGSSLLSGGSSKKSGGRRSRKKSALWYAKEIQRLKLKRRFEKVKFGVR